MINPMKVDHLHELCQTRALNMDESGIICSETTRHQIKMPVIQEGFLVGVGGVQSLLTVQEGRVHSVAKATLLPARSPMTQPQLCRT